MDFIIFLFVKVILLICRVIPRPIILKIAYLISDIVRLLDKRHRRIAISNLSIAFPDISKERKKAIIKECYRNFGRLVVEIARIPILNKNNIERLVEYHNQNGIHNYLKAKEMGKPIIFLAAHFGAWELLPAAHAIYGYPLAFIVRPLENRYLDDLLTRIRCLNGNQVIPKKGSIKEILRKIREGVDIGILIDQRVARHEGIRIEFFGVLSSSSFVIPMLAMRTGCPVMPVYMDYDPERDRHIIVIKPPLRLVSTGDRKYDLLENTKICMKEIEEMIRERPGLWLWMHRRWKERDLYPLTNSSPLILNPNF
jgi:KDO2-lipid IV(A) lauroyltransferase